MLKLAGCDKTILATTCNSGTLEPFMSHHMYAGVVLAPSNTHDGKHGKEVVTVLPVVY